MTDAMMRIFAFIVPIGIGRNGQKVYSPTIEHPRVNALRPYLPGYKQIAYMQASEQTSIWRSYLCLPAERPGDLHKLGFRRTNPE
jgi:hypothetical protein